MGWIVPRSVAGGAASSWSAPEGADAHENASALSSLDQITHSA